MKVKTKQIGPQQLRFKFLGHAASKVEKPQLKTCFGKDEPQTNLHGEYRKIIF